MFISVALSNSKFNFKVFFNLIFHPAGNARELVKFCVCVCECMLEARKTSGEVGAAGLFARARDWT